MIAYSAKNSVEGKAFVTTVDLSWNEAWNGSEQRRFWKIEDGKFSIESAAAPAPNSPRQDVGRWCGSGKE